jgi:hypothetical protein
VIAGTSLGAHGHAVEARRPFTGSKARKPSEVALRSQGKHTLYCPECDGEMTLYATELSHCDACGSDWYVRQYGGGNRGGRHVFVDITKLPA